ncbi:MAG: hypothetical protein ABIF88_03795 [archaeon]
MGIELKGIGNYPEEEQKSILKVMEEYGPSFYPVLCRDLEIADKWGLDKYALVGFESDPKLRVQTRLKFPMREKLFIPSGGVLRVCVNYNYDYESIGEAGFEIDQCIIGGLRNLLKESGYEIEGIEDLERCSWGTLLRYNHRVHNAEELGKLVHDFEPTRGLKEILEDYESFLKRGLND